MSHTPRARPTRPTRSIEGDVHIGTMAADVPLVPGSTTPEGAAAIERQARRALARVRHDIERRNRDPYEGGPHERTRVRA